MPSARIVAMIDHEHSSVLGVMSCGLIGVRAAAPSDGTIEQLGRPEIGREPEFCRSVELDH